MNKKTLVYTLVVLVAVLLVGYFFVKPMLQDRTIVTDTMQRIDNKDLDFSFAFPSGEGALTSIESTPEQLAGTPLQHMYVLMENKAYLEFQSAPSGQMKTPPAISVLVFNETEEDQTAATGAPTAYDKIRLWANKNDGYTNISSARDGVEELKIDGVPSVRYANQGLYKQNVSIARTGGRFYLIVGQYETEGDYLSTVYQDLIDSIIFE
ncbi:MAG: hypothetical protein H6779_03830 [Candidatus Nomurabacteria bacterium]|nr:MAG: hypothetical protein H6779_03830 [Candidatus Nomurabacteria bacterium]